MKVITQMRRAD